jgi:uncharacterized protein YbjT (DUF2867 family)
VRALVHRQDQITSIKALGVEDVVAGNLFDVASLQQAAAGVRAIYHIAPNMSPDELSIGKAMIAAAQSAQIEHFVFHSVLHPQIEAMPHHWLKLRVEELLFESGLSFTILQQTAYMQNILAYWEQICGHGRYALPYSPETRLSLVDLNDVAQAATIVLTEREQIGATIELVGTPGLSQIEIAEVITQELGRPVAAEVVALETWEQGARASSLGDYQVMTLMKMFHYYQSYGFVGNTNALKCLLKRQPASFTDFVRRTIKDRENDRRVS